MKTWIARLALALGGALALFTAGVVPAQAAGSPVSAGPRVPMAAAEPARLAGAVGYLRTHPLEGRVAPLAGPGAGVARGIAGVWRYWWGARVYLTPYDVRTLFYSLVIYGTTATVSALCTTVAMFEPLCGAAGIVVGYFIADAVWRAGVYRHGCGLFIDIYWNFGWRSWGC